MGKKKPEEMAKVRMQFLEGASGRGVDAALAGEIFDLMEKFAGYAFNKSHSATYALVSFQTAWLKAHHPAEFMAATLSADMQNIDKVVTLVDEARRMGLRLLPPSVNRSRFRFTGADGQVIYGLGAVRGVGEGPVAALEAARDAGGPFADIHDFCRRVDARKANKRVVEALIRSGAMDDFMQPDETPNEIRARLMAELPDALQGAEQVARNSAAGMGDLFGGPEQAPVSAPRRHVVVPLSTRERLEGEKEALGLYLTGHPIEDYREELAHVCSSDIADLRARRGNQFVAGLVVSSRVVPSRRGGDNCFLEIDDRSGRIEASLFGDVYENSRQKIAKGVILVVEGEVQFDDFGGALKLRAERVHTVEEVRQRFAGGVLLDLSTVPEPVLGDLSTRLRACLEPYRRSKVGCPVELVYQAAAPGGARARGRIRLGPDWQVSPSEDLLERLRAEFGANRVSLRYGIS